MMIMFFFFGYQKWWAYEAERLVPFISNGPLIWWLYPCSATRARAGSSRELRITGITGNYGDSCIFPRSRAPASPSASRAR
jgi:hypothetical protein